MRPNMSHLTPDATTASFMPSEGLAHFDQRPGRLGEVRPWPPAGEAHGDINRFSSTYLDSFQCPFCSSAWPSNFELQSHISKQHGNKMPFVCSLCGKGYRTHAGLNLHIQVHEGKSYPCPLCDSRFSQKGKVKRHLHNIHSATQCPVCSGIFKRGEEYNKHVLECR